MTFSNPIPLAWSAPAPRSAAPASESDLVARATRDREAFAELYRLHYAAIGRYLLRRTGDPHATEDLLSEVFLAALRALPSYRDRGLPFRAWLYRIATNAANRRRPAPRAPLEDAADIPAPREPDASGRALAELRSLTPAHQAVLTLFYVEDLGVEEIASVLRCSAGTVKSRLARARQALAARLGGTLR